MERGCMETDGPEFINLQEHFKEATASRHQASHCLGRGQQAAEYRQRLSEPKNRKQIYLWIVANDPSDENNGRNLARASLKSLCKYGQQKEFYLTTLFCESQLLSSPVAQSCVLPQHYVVFIKTVYFHSISQITF